MQNLVQRRIYPFLLMVVVLMGILSFQVRQFKRLYEHIKNDKWVYSGFFKFFPFTYISIYVNTSGWIQVL